MEYFKKGIKLSPETKLNELLKSNNMGNVDFICYPLQENDDMPKKEHVVNIDCDINDGISSYRTFEMTVTVELLNEVINYCLTKKDNEKEDILRAYEDIQKLFFIPMGKVEDIQNSILFCICLHEEARQKILNNPEGAYNLHLNMNIEEHSCFVSFKGTDSPKNDADEESKFVPHMEIGDSQIACTPGPVVDLLFITDAFFFRGLMRFILEKGQPMFKFTLEQLKGFLFVEKPVNPKKRIIKILENFRFYKLIEYQPLTDDEGQETFMVILFHFDYYNNILNAKE